MLNYEYPPIGGGAGNATYYLLQRLSRFQTVQIDLITSSSGKFHTEKISENITIYFVDIRKKSDLHYQTMFNLLVYSYKAYTLAIKLHKTEKYNVVHAFFGIPSGFIAMLLNIPYIVALRGSDVPFYNARFRFLDTVCFRFLSKLIWSKAAFVTTNSEGLKNMAQKTSNKTPISIIENGVDTVFFRAYEPKKTDIEQLKIISVGRLIPRKGFDLLIKAIADKPNFSLRIAGSGPELTNLQNLTQQLNANCSFLGNLNSEALRTELVSADVFVLSSHNEGMSNAALEAMACGLPVILSAVGGAQELVRQSGFILEENTPACIAEKLSIYNLNRQLLAEHSAGAIRLAQAKSWGEVAQRYVELYTKAACAE